MRQEVYRVAYDEASAELSQILAKFEQLRLRKDRIEKVVEALKPLVVTGELRAVPAPAERAIAEPEAKLPLAAEPAAAAPAPVPESMPFSVPPTADEAADPFSRRVENVMGMSSAARDVREYSRLFNSSSSSR